MEGFQLRNRDEDDDSFFAATNVDLTGSRNLKDAEVTFEFRYIVFEVDQSLCYIFFNFFGSGSWGVGGTKNLVVDGGHLEKKRTIRSGKPESTSNPKLFHPTHPEDQFFQHPASHVSFIHNDLCRQINMRMSTYKALYNGVDVEGRIFLQQNFGATTTTKPAGGSAHYSVESARAVPEIVPKRRIFL